MENQLRKISITEALNELKLYDSKINKSIQNGKFIGSAKTTSDRIGVQSKENFERLAKSDYQSVNDLILNRSKLKSSIVNSNAITKVNINGTEMTVAEAIERKSSIVYEQNLLHILKQQYNDASNTVLRENKKVDEQVNKLLETLVGKDSEKKITKEDQEAIEKPYRDKNEFSLVDPMNLYEEIQKLEAKIDGFNSNVNTALVLSNATTFIEI